MTLKDQLIGLTPSVSEVRFEPGLDVQRPLRPSSVPGKRPPASAPRPAPVAAFAALQPAEKIHWDNFPLRLSRSTIAQLAEWKRTKGIVPGLLVREMVEKGVADLQRGFEKESESRQ